MNTKTHNANDNRDVDATITAFVLWLLGDKKLFHQYQQF